MKKILMTILFILISLCAFSQIQPEEKKSGYKSEDKIYWNKSLPITITLSSPNDTSIKLDKPFYLDTEGVNYIRTKWEMDSTGNYVTPFREQLWKIYADSKPPKTSKKFIASSSYKYKGQTYYSDDLKVELISVDELSGVKKIYYSINGSDFVLYEKFIIFEAGMDVNLKFYAVDNVGNVEDISNLSYDYDNNNLKFGIDNTSPETNIVSKDSLLSPKDVIDLESNDSEGVGVYGIFYHIDDTVFNEYKQPIKLSNLKNGKHKLTYYSQDWVNNKEADKIFDFYLDAIAPEINILEEIINQDLMNLRFITLSAIDNKSGVDKILIKLTKEEEFKEYIEPFYVDITHQEIKIKAIDGVGNESIRTIKYNEIR